MRTAVSLVWGSPQLVGTCTKLDPPTNRHKTPCRISNQFEATVWNPLCTSAIFRLLLVRSQDFQKGGYMDVCMPVCMHNFISMLASFDWGVGGMLPQEIFKILRLFLRPF